MEDLHLRFVLLYLLSSIYQTIVFSLTTLLLRFTLASIDHTSFEENEFI